MPLNRTGQSYTGAPGSVRYTRDRLVTELSLPEADQKGDYGPRIHNPPSVQLQGWFSNTLLLTLGRPQTDDLAYHVLNNMQ